MLFHLNLLGGARGTGAHLNGEEKEGNVKIREREQLMELDSQEGGRKWDPASVRDYL